MDLKSPSTLAVAWLLVPFLVVVASAGLGAGLSRLSGMNLGALTLPGGFMAGVVAMTFSLEIGFGGIATVVLSAVLAIVGLASFALPKRHDLAAWRPSTEFLWIVGCAVAAFAIAMAPLIGSGRSGVLGYVFNNDSSVHISAVELLRDHGAATVPDDSSYHSVARLFSTGYPLGSYTWPLFGSVLGGIDAFHIWTPVMAVVSVMMSLVAFSVLRSMCAPPPFAALAGTLIASGYLPFAYLGQGSAKETATALGLYTTVALFALAVTRGLQWRQLLPAAIAAAATADIFGVGAVAWLGPAALLVLVVLLARPPRVGRARALAPLAAAAVVAIAAAVPSIASSLDFVNTNRNFLDDPDQVGNLIGAVPWAEAFNIWLAYDYRLAVPEVELLTHIGLLLAGLLAVAGVLYALSRRSVAVPLAVVTAIAGSVLISRRYSIYFDAKTYMVLGPALGMASAAGLLWLSRLSGRTAIPAMCLGAILGAGVLVSDGMVYAAVWNTPKDRFQELIDINERFSGQGPTLVNERDDYAKLLLRDVSPWESWGPWQPDRGLRFPNVPAVPRTPDFDDYEDSHMARFGLLVERKRPAGSLPPGNFRIAWETQHYRVWRRDGSPPRRHLPLQSKLSGWARLDCRDQSVSALFARARADDERVRIAFGGPRPILSYLGDWQHAGEFGPGPQRGLVAHRGGFAVTAPKLPRGRYRVMAQGSFGPGIRLYMNGRQVGEAFADLGLQDGWQPLGFTTVKHQPPLSLLIGLDKPWWQAGSRRNNVEGPFAFEPTGRPRRVAYVMPRRTRKLCGRSLDWIELPAR